MERFCKMANGGENAGIAPNAQGGNPVPVVGVAQSFKPFKFEIYDPSDSCESYIQRFENACHLRNYM